jgi:hypothetical protein
MSGWVLRRSLVALSFIIGGFESLSAGPPGGVLGDINQAREDAPFANSPTSRFLGSCRCATL